MPWCPAPCASLLVASLVLAAPCAMAVAQPTPPSAPDANRQGGDAFVNRVWVVVASSGVAPGTLYTFLSDGTLVISSRHGTPGVGRWSRSNAGLVLVEEGRSYPAEIVELRSERFRLRISNPGQPTDVTFAPAPQRMDGPGAPGPGSITPIPSSYECRGESYKVAFEEGAAYVTLPDGSQVTLPRLARPPGDEQPRSYTNGRLTVTQDARSATPRVTIARGRMAPVPCTLVP